MPSVKKLSGHIALCFGVMFFFAVHPASAHSPFESSTRAIARDTTVEITLTVGMDGGKALLEGAPQEAFRIRTVGSGFELPKEFAAKFFTASSGRTALVPNKIEARTDGLEFNIFVEFPRPAGAVMGLDALYVEKLPAAFKSSFAMTDENGNTFATRLLKQDDHAFEVKLPAPAPTETAVGAGAVTNNPAQLISKTQAVVVAAPTVSSPASSVAVQIEPVTPAKQMMSFKDFLNLGIGHILNIDAFDHLLFLIALLLGCRRLKPMLLVITGFTLAHSFTLALAALNLVTVSLRIVEPLIAVSIIFVAAENFRREEKSWHRYALTCGFGLIHGFAFASTLRESALGGKGAEIVMPLFGFNLGVEIGQLAVAAVVLPLLFALRKIPAFEKYGARIISAVVILIAAFWLWQRLAVSGG